MSFSLVLCSDPCGVLEPGEIYIESREKILVDKQGRPTDKVLGEVLVSRKALIQYNASLNLTFQITRNPCKLPTDVQQVSSCA